MTIIMMIMVLTLRMHLWRGLDNDDDDYGDDDDDDNQVKENDDRTRMINGRAKMVLIMTIQITMAIT